MSRRVAVSELNASTIDILNVIRQNASAEYQSLVPKVIKETDIPKVGEVLYGYPALANQFINALVNRIALVRVKSATFNNDFVDLKKGYLEFGETVEEVFVNIAKAREFSVEKAESREFKRTLPDVRSAMHVMNWRVQYPVTIQDEDLRMAFLSAAGVQDLIARIVDSVYTAANYDEWLLFKYLIIKSVSHGKMFPVAFDASVPTNAAVEFRTYSNLLTIMSTKYNDSGVHTVTPKSDQYIFMDSRFNAQFDVNVLSAAFHMDKADFMGRLKLLDDFTSFDNERFSVIVDNSDMIEPVTANELAIMANVKAVLVDGEFFQIYDNQNKFTEKYVASGEYWNYFYNVWKTVSTSPFSNAIVFVDDAATVTNPNTITVTINSKSVSDAANVYGFVVDDSTPSLVGAAVEFVQTQSATQAGVAVQKYGAYILPTDAAVGITVTYGGDTYNSADGAYLTKDSTVSTSFVLTKAAAAVSNVVSEKSTVNK